MNKTTETMCQMLGDGSHICDKCWAIEYPNKTEPETNWMLACCDYCNSDNRQESEVNHD